NGAQGKAGVSVTGSEQDFSAQQKKTYFIVLKLAGSATPGETLKFKVSDITGGGNTQKSGVPTTTEIDAAAIKAPDLTLADASPQAVQDAILGTPDNLLQV